ncbi:MAG: GTP-binding protein, partial [Anaerolineae bacterium]
NCLQGWEVSAVQHDARDVYEPAEESLGLFTLIDLPNVESRPNPVRSYDFPYGDGLYDGPAYAQDGWHTLEPALWSLVDVDLVIFVIDGAAGLRPVDYQWFVRIRAAGCPILVVLNKIDLLGDDCDQVAQDLRRRLASPVVAVSARDGTCVYDVLLPQILDLNPSLAVPLGREVAACRRQAAARLIRRSALMCGLLGVEPMPLLDVPFQLITQMHLVMRLAAMYGRGHIDRPLSSSADVGGRAGLSTIVSGTGREVLMTLLGGLGLRYLAQQLIKLIPVLGWLLSGALSASSTWLIGWAAVTYFERAQDGAPVLKVPGGALGWLRDRTAVQGGAGAEGQMNPFHS